jgi:hypothetical protein
MFATLISPKTTATFWLTLGNIADTDVTLVIEHLAFVLPNTQENGVVRRPLGTPRPTYVNKRRSQELEKLRQAHRRESLNVAA